MSAHIVEDAGVLKVKDGHQVLATGKQKEPGLYKFKMADGTERTIRVREQWRDDEIVEAIAP